MYGVAGYPNDNFLEIKLTASQQDGYYICKLDIRRPMGSRWYKCTSTTTNRPALAGLLSKGFQGFDIMLDINPKYVKEKYVGNQNGVPLEVEWGKDFYHDDIGENYGWGYDWNALGLNIPHEVLLRDMRTTLGNFYILVRWVDAGLGLQDYLVMEEGIYYHLVTFKLEIPASASGIMEVTGRLTSKQYSPIPSEMWGEEITAFHSTALTNSKANPTGVCFTGSGAIDLGGGEPIVVTPEIESIARKDGTPVGTSDGTPTNYVVSTVDDVAYEDVTWELKTHPGGAPVTGATLTPVGGTNGGEVRVTWPSNAIGTYDLCATASVTGSEGTQTGAQFCETITICPPITVNIAQNPLSVCVGDPVTLTPSFVPNVEINTSTYKWNNVVSASDTKIVTATATSTAYTFTAQTTAGGCAVTGTANVRGNAPATPVVAYELRDGASIAGTGQYQHGDIIDFTVAGTYASYEWTVNGSVVGTAPMYTLFGATAASYTVSVKITDAGGCSATSVPVSLNRTGSCQAVLELEPYGDNVKMEICTGGVFLMENKLSCGTAPIYCLVYKQEGTIRTKIDSVPGGALIVLEGTGEYVVEAYTYRGVFTASKNITASSMSFTESQKVKVFTPLAVLPNSQITLIAGNAEAYLWTPADKLAQAQEAQKRYPTTAALSANTRYTVYGAHSNGCYSQAVVDVEVGTNALNVELNVNGAIQCADGRARLAATVTGGTAPYTYRWEGTGNTFLEFDQQTETPETYLQLTDGEGTYYYVVHVTDADGKIGTDVVELKVSADVFPNFQFSGIATGGKICQNAELLVTPLNVGASVATYTWYIRNNTTGVMEVKPPTTQNKLKLTERGEYTVWVAAQLNGGCYSDTSNARAVVSVKGFDLAWDPEPANGYRSGATLTAEAKATNFTTAINRFDWTVTPNPGPAGGRAVEQTQATNPNKYILEAAEAANYTFKVVARDGDACENTLTKTVMVKAVDDGLQLTVPKSVVYCTGGTVLIDAKVQRGTGPYSFRWYDATQPTVNVQGPTNNVGNATGGADRFVSTLTTWGGRDIVVEVTDNSTPKLTLRDTIRVISNSSNAPVVAIDGGDIMIPTGTATWLTAQLTQGTAASWHWTDVAKIAEGAATNTPKTTPLSGTQMYTVYAKDAAGCTSNLATVNVGVTASTYPLSINWNPPAQMCNGSAAELVATVEPAGTIINTWKWSASHGTFAASAASSTTYTTTGISGTGMVAELIVSATTNDGVTIRSKKNISLLNSSSPIVSIVGDANLCGGATLSATPSTGISKYFWREGAGAEVETSSPNFTVSDPASLETNTTVYLRALTSDGCPSQGTAEKEILIRVNPIVAWDEDNTSPTTVDPGDPVKATAKLTKETEAPYTWTWSHPAPSLAAAYTDGNGTSAATSSESTVDGNADEATLPYIFRVEVADANGCIASTDTEMSITLNGDRLFVSVASLYGAYCVNGVALLRATVIVPPGITEADLNYEWFKNDAPFTAVTKQRELLITEPNTTDEYFVKVTVDNSVKTGDTDASKVKLVASGTAAPDIRGVNARIPVNTKTALLATSDQPITTWQWSPEDKLASGESQLSNPYTTILTTTQNYTVYGVAANNCVDTAAVRVSVSSYGTPGTDDVFAKVMPGRDTICVGNELALNTEVWPGAGAPVYEWQPASNLSAYNTANPIFNPSNADLPAGLYTYTVKVTRGGMTAFGRVEILVVPGISPTLAESGTSLLCAGGTVKVYATNGVPVTKYTWFNENGEIIEDLTGDTYTWPDVQTSTRLTMRVIAETSGHCISKDTLELRDRDIQPAVELGDLHIAEQCGEVILYSDAGNVPHDWTLTSGAAWLNAATVSGRTDTLRLTISNPFTTASQVFSVEVEVQPAGGGCASVGSITDKIYLNPQVALMHWTPSGESMALPYRMTEAGSVTGEQIDIDLVNSAFTTGNSNVTWQASKATVTPITNAATVTNIQEDDTVVITVTNKELVTCFATDSLPLYTYPEAPQIEIDTNTCLTDIALSWKSVNADSVRIWGIVDDAYNVLGGGYKHLASVLTSALKWVEPDMNTRLKFYYLQSVKKIQGRSFVSEITSDTVGWLKQALKNYNTDASGTELVLAYPFDMTSKGIQTNRDIFEKMIDRTIGTMGGSIGKWDFITQQWKKEDLVDLMGDGSMMIWNDLPFDIMSGDVLNMTFAWTTNLDKNILMYGKLMRHVFNLNMNVGGLGSEDFILYSLSMIEDGSRQGLGTLLPTDFLGAFDYTKQAYDNAGYIDLGGFGMWDPDESVDTFLLKPWQPVRVTVKQQVNWSK
jgi:hypothetical protein